MPTLRQPRLASRKSIALDHRLYSRTSDQSDSEEPADQSYSRHHKLEPKSLISGSHSDVSLGHKGNSNAEKIVGGRRKKQEAEATEEESASAGHLSVALESDRRSKRQKVSNHSTDAAKLSNIANVRRPAASTSRSRPGFLPRAAATAVKSNRVPPAYLNAIVDSAAEDSELFSFSTHPPTPHAIGKGKRAAEKTAENTKTLRTFTKGSSIKPAPSFSQRIPINVAETPVQVKNILLRNGGEATPCRLNRRASGGRSSKRASSIGTGFEAAPHPGVPDDKLYRSTDIDAPLAIRLRSLISWTAQRSRDEVFARHMEKDSARHLSFGIIRDFIDGICNKSIDFTAQFYLDGREKDMNELPPHPQNEINAAKMNELTESYAAIAREEEDRRTILVKYEFIGATNTIESFPESSKPIAVNFEKSRPLVISDIDTAVLFGGGILDCVPLRSSNQSSSKNEKIAVLGETTDDTLRMAIRCLSFRHTNHRLAHFARTVSSYADMRLGQSHRALAAESARGVEDKPPSPSMSASGTSHRDIAKVLISEEPVVPGPVLTSRSLPEARDLLRAIADSDTRL